MGYDITGDIWDIYCSIDLGGRHIVTILVDSSHIIQDIKHVGYLCRLFKLPPETKKSHTGTSAERFQDCLCIHATSYILKPQGRDAGKRRAGEIHNGALVTDDERGNG